MNKQPADTTITVRLEKKDKEELKALCRATGKSTSTLVRQLIEDRLQRRGDHR